VLVVGVNIYIKGRFPGKSMVFRLATKSFFLTYPKCPIKKEIALAQLQDKVEIVKYIVAEEKHEDGSDHLHAHIICKRKYNFKSPRCFDLEENGVIYHGDYQSIKNHHANQTYCRKSGNFIEQMEDNEHEDIFGAFERLDEEGFLKWCTDNRIGIGYYNEVKRIRGSSTFTINEGIDNHEGNSCCLIS